MLSSQHEVCAIRQQNINSVGLHYYQPVFPNQRQGNSAGLQKSGLSMTIINSQSSCLIFSGTQVLYTSINSFRSYMPHQSGSVFVHTLVKRHAWVHFYQLLLHILQISSPDKKQLSQVPCEPPRPHRHVPTPHHHNNSLNSARIPLVSRESSVNLIPFFS